MIPRGEPFPALPGRYLALLCPSCAYEDRRREMRPLVVFSLGPLDRASAHDRLDAIPFYRYTCERERGGCGYVEIHLHRLQAPP